MLRKILRNFKNKLTERDDPLMMAQNRRYAAYQIGEGTYGRPEINFYDEGTTLKIGRYCSIAGRVTILLSGEHHHDWVSNYPFSVYYDEARDLPGYPMSKGDVIIGNDVWIGYDALILSGVTIGDGAVIAARSLVNKDVAPYSIVGGVPAKHLRYRFSETTIKALQEIAWWNWSAADIRAVWHLIQSPNVEEFIAHCLPKTEK